MSRCGRPTKSGRPCRGNPIASPPTWRINAMFGQVPAPGEMPHSCHRHLTEQEAVMVAELYRNDEAEMNRLVAAERLQTPACWDWPVADEDLVRADGVREIGDLGSAYVAATRLLRAWQAGRCAICGCPEPASVLDHDHATGLIRGRLCRSCNLLEGFAGDPEDPCVLYRTRNPASMLGIKMPYYSPFTGWAEPEPNRLVDLDRSPGYLLAAYLADGDDEG